MPDMPESTIRDDIWKDALARAHRAGQPVRPEDVVEKTGAAEQTVRDALNVMAEAGWIKRDVSMDGKVRYLPVDVE